MVLYLIWVHGIIVPIIGTMKKAISSEQYFNLIQWLKQSRLELGWSMRELATKLEEPHSFVQKVEMMERKLDVYEYVIYCKALNLNPADGMQYLQ
jgi:hypothetical protein